jgi:hypothetical protein
LVAGERDSALGLKVRKIDCEGLARLL